MYFIVNSFLSSYLFIESLIFYLLVTDKIETDFTLYIFQVIISFQLFYILKILIENKLNFSIKLKRWYKVKILLLLIMFTVCFSFIIVFKMTTFNNENHFVENVTKNNVSFQYYKGDENHIDEISKVIENEKNRFDEIFGEVKNDDLKVIIDSSLDNNENSIHITDMGGYYNTSNQTLYLLKETNGWKNILLHEYTHYRIHHFYLENNLPMGNIPVWFEEGIAEYMAGPLTLIAPSQIEEEIDFRLFNDSKDFHDSNNQKYLPYSQSYFAVELLVRNHGVTLIPKLLMSNSFDSFYKILENHTGKTLEEFQGSFLQELSAYAQENSKKFNIAIQAVEEGEYETAEDLLLEQINNGTVDEIQKAQALLNNTYLKSGDFNKLQSSLEVKIKGNSSKMQPTEFIILAELYLLSDTEESLSILKEFKKNITSDDLFFGQIDSLIEIYQKINSNELLGFQDLINEDMMFNEEIRLKLLRKLKNDYPGEF